MFTSTCDPFWACKMLHLPAAAHFESLNDLRILCCFVTHSSDDDYRGLANVVALCLLSLGG